jgi:hypothetical protein
MRFEMRHKVHKDSYETFSDLDAPEWLTSTNTVKGSTMDHRWFWNKHVLTLDVGASVETDFHVIKRIA